MNIPAGAPVSAISRAYAALGNDMRVLDFTDEQMKRVNSAYDLWTRYVIPADTYPSQNKPINTIAQPNFLVAGALAAAVSVFRPRLMRWTGRRAALLLALGLCLPPLVTLARNWTVSGEPILISTNGGINFFIGNNPTADGTFRIPSDSGLVDRAEGLFITGRDVAQEAKPWVMGPCVPAARKLKAPKSMI